MKNFQLSQEELIKLRAAHQGDRDKRSAYRMNAIILLGSGWTPKQVSAALLIDDSTIRFYVKRTGIDIIGLRSTGPKKWIFLQ